MGHYRVHELIAESQGVESVEGIHSLCASVCDAFGFDYFLYGARLPSSLVRPFMFLVSGFPDEWRERYASQRYLAIDPTVAHCLSSACPIIWDDLARECANDSRAQAFLDEARQYGLLSGVSLPVRGGRGEVGMLTFACQDEGDACRERIEQVLPHVFLLSVHVHEAALGLMDKGRLPFKPTELTPRERECLVWAAEGKTSWETAQILGISERTVIFHLRNVVEKLNVSSRQQAIARAIYQGLITPKLD